jgi:murein L,D-transpeptidase YcbB/YkuD
MNELKYQITQIVFLVALGLGTYWAFTHIDNGIRYERDEVVTIAQNQENVPDETITIIDNEINLPASNTPTNQPLVPPQNVVIETTPDNNASKNSGLVTELKKIIETGIIMESGSTGSRVATVQEFLDIYFSTRDVTIDSDYGPGTTRLVRDFQTAELSGGDGRVGPNTLRAMVTWLESN